MGIDNIFSDSDSIFDSAYRSDSLSILLSILIGQGDGDIYFYCTRASTPVVAFWLGLITLSRPTVPECDNDTQELTRFWTCLALDVLNTIS